MSFYGDIQRWWIGTVEEDSGKTDPNGLGRCRVRIDGIHGPDISLDDLPYAQTILPATGGGTSGIGENPQLLPGAKVIGFFLDGVMSQLPVIWGFLPHTATPTIIQQEIIAKEKRSIIQTHSTKDFKLESNNIKNPKSVPTNVETAWDFFTGPLTKRTYSKEQAAGIIGNLMHESSFDTDINPIAVELKTAKGFGIAQWTSTAERYKELVSFSRTKNGSFEDLLIQLAFIDHELNKYLWARKTFFETTTVEAASMQFCRYYLRPEFTAETTILFPVKDGGRFPSGENKKRKGETNRFENATEVYRLLSQGGNK
jgi:hypothetical protein